MSRLPSESEFKSQAYLALLPYALQRSPESATYQQAFEEAADLAEIATTVALKEGFVGRDPWWKPAPDCNDDPASVREQREGQ